jgi:sulfur-carrier protein
MIQVKFFASLREQLATRQLELVAEYPTAGALRQALAARSPVWARVLGADSVLVAINQSVQPWSTPLVDGDEVAFFPPVTGG